VALCTDQAFDLANAHTQLPGSSGLLELTTSDLPDHNDPIHAPASCRSKKETT
jgi:hypothetical protein